MALWKRWASRFLQISLALPEHPAAPTSAARVIPIDPLSGGRARPLRVCADATFSNRTVLRDLPPRHEAPFIPK